MDESQKLDTSYFADLDANGIPHLAISDLITLLVRAQAHAAAQGRAEPHLWISGCGAVILADAVAGDIGHLSLGASTWFWVHEGL